MWSLAALGCFMALAGRDKSGKASSRHTEKEAVVAIEYGYCLVVDG